jgi:hypothetical protein
MHNWLHTCICDGCSERNLRWVVNKTSSDKKLACKIMVILKLLLKAVTARIVTLVVSGNKLLYSCVKSVCRLWTQPRFDTFHQLLIIVEVLWSQLVLRVGKRVIVSQREIRAVRRVTKQLPVEMLQQCSSASSCTSMRTCIVTRSTTPDVSIPRLSSWMVLHSFL